MKDKKSFDDLESEVVSSGLCTHCGTCAGVCPVNALEIKDELGDCIPELTGDCIECGLCYESCPGKNVDFRELNKRIFNKKYKSPLGNYNSIYVGHSKDEGIRGSASSGGVVTSILVSLIRKGEIDGAVVVGRSKEHPWKPEVKIARDEKEIIDAAQSKYVLTPVNIILKELKKERGKYAVVALPCQVHAIRKLEKTEPSLTKNIRYIIGLYCGNNLHFSATRDMLDRMGVKDIEQVRSIEYRAGEWPGSFKATLKNDKFLSVEKKYFSYLIPLHLAYRCSLCIDLTNEFSDISVGDCWLPNKTNESTIIVRTPKGIELLNKTSGEIYFEKISEEEVIDMHAHLIEYKKKGALTRIKMLTSNRKPAPSYNLSFPSANKTETLKQILLLKIFSNRLLNGTLKAIARLIPLRISGNMMHLIKKRKGK